VGYTKRRLPHEQEFAMNTSALFISASPSPSTDMTAKIQSALDSVGMAGGGEVILGTGLFTLGTPFDITARPLFIWSNTLFRGMGRGATILKVCDEARMFREEEPNRYYAAALLVNKHSPLWHTGLTNDDRDRNITIRDLSLDGNAAGQPSICIPGNRTDDALPDGLYAQTATPAGGGSLVVGHKYSIAVTYTDSQGRETGLREIDQITLAGGQTAILLTLPPAPTGAVQIVVYLRDETSDPNDVYGHPVFFERQGPQTLVQNGGTILVTNHTAGTARLPGFGLVGDAEGTASYGINLDNCERCLVSNVDIYDVVLDGFACSSNHGMLLRDSVIENCWVRRCGRDALSITGKVDNLEITRLFMSDCSLGTDIEPGFAGLPVANVHFDRCTFRNMFRPGGAGISMSPHSGGTTLKNIAFERCLFELNLLHVQSNNQSNDLDASFKNCVFKNSLNYSINVAGGHFSFDGECQFIRNGYEDVWYVPGGATGADLLFENPGAIFQRFRVAGAYFEKGTPSSGGIEIRGTTGGHKITDCHFDQGSGGYTYVSIPSSSAAALDIRGLTGIVRVQELPSYNVIFDSVVGTTTPAMSAAQDAKQFGVAVGAADTSLVVTFANSLATGANYIVQPSPAWDWGSWWITGKSSTGFTLNWQTPPGGSGSTIDWFALS
jgi:hypothetical protein